MSQTRAPTRKPGPAVECRAEVAAEASAAAMNRLADEVGLLRQVAVQAVEEMKTAKQFVDRLDVLCAFLRRWFKRLIAFGPLLLLLFNGLSPEVNGAVKILIERAIIGLANGG